jgi:hypothetical protein
MNLLGSAKTQEQHPKTEAFPTAHLRPSVLSWLRLIMALLISASYATSLALLPVDAFKDRDNYLHYAEFSSYIIEKFADSGLLTLLSNEPLWLLANASIGQFLSPEWTIRAIIFASAFTTSFVLYRKYSGHLIWLTLFLLSPQILKDFVIHLRQGLGLSIFLLGYFASPLWIRTLLIISAGLIHSSFFIVTAIGMTAYLSERISVNLLIRIGLVTALFTVTIFSLVEIANFVGARQADRYADITLKISGLGFLLWAGMLAVFLTSGPKFIEDHIFAASLLSCYLAAYFVTPLAARIFESGLPIVLTAGLFLKPLHKMVFLSIFVFYGAYMYIGVSGTPWLGWGI